MTTRTLAVQVPSREFGGMCELVKKRWVADDDRGLAGIPTHLAAGCWWGSYDAMHGPKSRRECMLAEPAGSKAISKEAL